MFCKNCGTKLQDAAKFCGQCGAIVGNPETTKGLTQEDDVIHVDDHSDTNDVGFDTANDHVDTNDVGSETYEDSEGEKLLSIIFSIKAKRYYKYGIIPEKKLVNAYLYYDIDKSDTIIALIDTTTFGNAKTGVAIGLLGIYWNNPKFTSTKCNFIAWEDLYEVKDTIHDKDFAIELREGIRIARGGSDIEKDDFVNLLKELIDYHLKVPFKSIDISESNLEALEDDSSSKAGIDRSDIIRFVVAIAIAIACYSFGASILASSVIAGLFYYFWAILVEGVLFTFMIYLFAGLFLLIVGVIMYLW